MAKSSDDAGQWPPHDDNNVVVVDTDPFGFPSEFPYELGISSPVESVAGSTETESSDEEEDFFKALSRRLSQCSLHDSRKHHPLSSSSSPSSSPIITGNKPEGVNLKTRGLAVSPQSTLSGIGSWSGRSAVSGDGSPNGSSRVPSQSTTPFGESNDSWEAIYAAAGQVARLKYLNRETTSFGFQNRGQISLPLHHAAPLFPNQASQVREEHVMIPQCGSSVWGRHQVKANLFVQQQQQQQQQLQILNRGRDFAYENVKCTRPSSAWPQLRPQTQNPRVQFTGSGSRPGSGAVKRPCGGTGVFLPRHYVNNNTEEPPRKKSGFAPVLVPAKVVHALNITTQSQFPNAFGPDYEALLARRNALLMQQQQRLILRPEEAANYETRLPQEWTY